MHIVRAVWGTLWRSAVVSFGYIAAMMAAGMAGGLLGLVAANTQRQSVQFGWLVVSSLLIGLFLGPLAARLPASRGQQTLIWASVVFFNMGSVVIEGSLFAPDLVPIPLSVLIPQQLLAALVVGLLIAFLFGRPSSPADWSASLRRRPWHGWAWRFVLSALGYVLFYYVFGALNYALITGPYYASHAGGLVAPEADLVLRTELVRAPLLVLSVWLFVLSLRATRRWAMVITGLMLFWIGGVVPLVIQLGSLPWLLLAASAVEIFCQNFLTGAVVALLLGQAQPAEQPLPPSAPARPALSRAVPRA